MDKHNEPQEYKLHTQILDAKRQNLLPELAWLRTDNWYLAGGTALALQIGHRDSIDFDFFRKESFDPFKLRQQLADRLASYSITVLLEAKDTLTVLLMKFS